MRDELLHKVEPGSYHSTLGGVARDAVAAVVLSGRGRTSGRRRGPPASRTSRSPPETTPGATGDAEDCEAPDTAVAAFVHVGVSVAVDGRVDHAPDGSVEAMTEWASWMARSPSSDRASTRSNASLTSHGPTSPWRT